MTTTEKDLVDEIRAERDSLRAELAAIRERCLNCGDRLDEQDGHCENCTARALRWKELEAECERRQNTLEQHYIEAHINAPAELAAANNRIAELTAELSTQKTNTHDSAANSAAWADACADCRAELARVKAESLRVVPDDNGEWWMTPSGPGWVSDRRGFECVETPTSYYGFDECQRIRLERWEQPAE